MNYCITLIPQWLAEPGLNHFLIISAILFSLGLLAVVTRRNVILVLMGVELILNSANINFIAFARYTTMSLDGHLIALFVIILAAAEAAIALAIVLNIYNRFSTVNVDEVSRLRE
jgi:NADH-quinone oxidoreductase subunit K